MQSLKLTIQALFLLGCCVTLSAQSSFFQVDKIQEIRILFEQEDWRYLLDSLRYNGEELLPAQELTINGKKFTGAGVRYREGRAFTPAARRNGLFIQLDLQRSGQSYQGYTTVDLSDAVRDPSMLREVLAHEIAQPYLPSPQANFAKVYINEELYGLFVNIETIDDAFLKRQFGSTQGALFASTPNYVESLPEGCYRKSYGSLQLEPGRACYQHHYTAMRGADWTKLEKLIQILNKSPEQIERVLDVDKTLWMLAFNNVLANLNSYSGQYSGNYLLYESDNGRFVPIITNFNFAFGSYKNADGGSDLGTVEMLQLDPLLHVESNSKPLISVLLNNEVYRKRYLAHMRTLLDHHFDDGKFAKRVETLQLLILPDLAEDVNKYYTMAEIERSLSETIGRKSKIPGLVSFMDKRVSFLKNHPAFRILPPTIEQVNVQQRERFSTERVTDFRIRAKVDQYTKKVQLFYRFNGDAPFQVAVMNDDGEHFDESAGDGIYGAIISPPNGQSQLEYYIQAENAKAVSYQPVDYTVATYKVSLSELNQ